MEHTGYGAELVISNNYGDSQIRYGNSSAITFNGSRIMFDGNCKIFNPPQVTGALDTTNAAYGALVVDSSNATRKLMFHDGQNGWKEVKLVD